MDKKQYAQGWNIGEFWRIVKNESQAKNKTNLKIRLENCEDDILKLAKNVGELLEAGEVEAAIKYNNTIIELINIKNYINNALKVM